MVPFSRSGTALAGARPALRCGRPPRGQPVLVAGTLYLESDAARTADIAKVTDPKLRAALEERRQLEDQIAGLRLRKPSMPAEQYDQELEKLVTALAQNSRTIQQLEGKK